MDKLTCFFVCATAATTAWPQANTSGGLLKECTAVIRYADTTKKATPEAIACLGFVQGFREGLWAANAVGNLACIPDQVTTGQLARVVVKHLKENPERLHLPRTVGIHTAFINAYPCPK